MIDRCTACGCFDDLDSHACPPQGRGREPGGPRVIHPLTRFEEDSAAQAFVANHPGGASFAEVGVMFGLTRERVRQIENRAFEKLRGRYLLEGLAPSAE